MARANRQSRRDRTAPTPDAPALPDELCLQPADYLDRHHPNNDAYMQSVEHVQRQILHASYGLRQKQVNILKTVFTGKNYAETARYHHTTGQTVSKLVNSEKGQRLLRLLQYHQTLLDGPNLAQRRAMLWRIAQHNENIDPKTSIAANTELNKMTYKEWEMKNPTVANGQQQQTPSVTININQELLPRGALD